MAGHRPVAAEGAVGVTGDTGVTLDQAGDARPVRQVDVRKLGDAGDLLFGCRVVGHSVDVQVSGVDAGGQRPRAAGAAIAGKASRVPHTGMAMLPMRYNNECDFGSNRKG